MKTEPAIERVSLTEFRRNLNEYLMRVAHQGAVFVITSYGKQVAVVQRPAVKDGLTTADV